jgi:hypothetical protein
MKMKTVGYLGGRYVFYEYLQGKKGLHKFLPAQEKKA